MTFFNVAQVVTEAEQDHANFDLIRVVARDLEARVRHAVAEDATVTVATEPTDLPYGLRVHARTPNWRLLAVELLRALRLERDGKHRDSTLMLMVRADKVLAEYPSALPKEGES